MHRSVPLGRQNPIAVRGVRAVRPQVRTAPAEVNDLENPTMTPREPVPASRREFLKASTTAAVGGAIAGQLSIARNAHAAGSGVLRVGLIGCGGRGTGAAEQALKADKEVKLVAMGDAFDDRISPSLARLKRDEVIAGKIDVPPEHCFTGFDAYKHVIDASDVVLLCTPPHFRPLHLKAAVEAGKHVFAEKPVAVDAPGVHSVLDTC